MNPVISIFVPPETDEKINSVILETQLRPVSLDPTLKELIKTHNIRLSRLPNYAALVGVFNSGTKNKLMLRLRSDYDDRTPLVNSIKLLKNAKTIVVVNLVVPELYNKASSLLLSLDQVHAFLEFIG